MNAILAARLVAGAQAGSIVLTRQEAQEFYTHVRPDAAVIIDGNPVRLHALPIHVLPDLEPSS